MNRFLILLSATFLILSCASSKNQLSKEGGYIYSVNGKMDIKDLGFSLTHEHIMSRFGLESQYNSEYNKDSLFNQVIPYLNNTKDLNVNSIFDCTTAFFGRHVSYLKEISEATGIQIITNTGYYGAAKDRYVPDFAFKAKSEDIAKIWISEFENGIDSTGIKPGFIKLAFDGGVSKIDLKLFEAGLLTHLNTGLTIVVHTGNNPEAVKAQLKLMNTFGVSPLAWVWVHANKVKNDSLLIKTAKKGAWISLDNVKQSNIDSYVNRIHNFKKANLLHKLLISHDGNSYVEKKKIRPYHAVITHLIPALKESGITDEDINKLFVLNPQNAFQIKIRKKN